MSKKDHIHDNLEQFFQKLLNNYSEDPGDGIWNNLESKIPEKPQITPPWTNIGYVGLSFVLGSLLTLFIYHHYSSNDHYLTLIQNKVKTQEEELIAIKKRLEFKQEETFQLQEQIVSLQDRNQSLIDNQLVIASDELVLDDFANKGRVISESALENQLVVGSNLKNLGAAFAFHDNSVTIQSNSFFTENPTLLPFISSFKKKWWAGGFNSATKLNEQPVETDLFDPTAAVTTIDKISFPAEIDQLTPKYQLDWEDRLFFDNKKFLRSSKKVLHRGIRPYVSIAATPATFGTLKYYGQTTGINLDPNEHFGSSFGIRVSGGLESGKNWVVQFGIDYTKLTIFSHNAYDYSFNREYGISSDNGLVKKYSFGLNGPFEFVPGTSSVLIRNQNQQPPLQEGNVFTLFATSKQPLRFTRIPILAGYKITLDRNWQFTPKAGFAFAWAKIGKVELEKVNTIDDRLEVLSSSIGAANSLDTEYLEAVVGGDLSYRFSPALYFTFEPRWYSGLTPVVDKTQYKITSQFWQLQLGVRYNFK